MSIIAIGIMWAFAVAVFAVITRWPMGEVSNERTAFWSKYDDK